MYRRGRANRLALRASPGETPDCLRSCRLPAGRKWLRPQVVAANGLRDFTAGRRIADTPRRCHQKLRGTPDRPQRPPPAAIAHGGEPTDLRPPEVCSSSSRRPTAKRDGKSAENAPQCASRTPRLLAHRGMESPILRVDLNLKFAYDGRRARIRHLTYSRTWTVSKRLPPCMVDKVRSPLADP